jgi:hypothetical protein
MLKELLGMKKTEINNPRWSSPMDPNLNSLIVVNETISSDEFVSGILKGLENIDVKPLFKESLVFDTWDWVVIGLSSILASLSDIVIGRKSGFKEPNIKNDSMLGLGKKIKQFEMKNNPIDFQDLKSFGGEHRLYSYGHDLLRFMEGVRQTMGGEYKGISSGFAGEVVKQFADYDPVSLEKAILINALHLIKDFCTKKSLPLPGMTILANLNNNQMPEFVEKLYCDYGVNLRTMAAQAISISVIEITIRLYSYLRYLDQKIDKDLQDEKLKKMLLLSHCIAGSINIGKVVITKNPFMLNTGQFILIIKYVVQLLNKQMDDLKIRIENKQTEVTNIGLYLSVSSLVAIEYESIVKANELILKNSQNLLNEFNDIHNLINN